MPVQFSNRTVQTRKSAQKAQAKFEPEVFRDLLVRHLQALPNQPATQNSNESRYAFFDVVAKKLDELEGETLDFRRYEQQLWEILLCGKLLTPSGSFVDDGADASPFSVFASMQEPVEFKDALKVVEVFHKLIRRYKYLQKGFEENSLKSILQHANKFSEVEVEKLATAAALFVSLGIANPNVVSYVKKDFIVKDGTALRFITIYLRTYLKQETPEHMASSLRRTGNQNLLQFFPPAQQTSNDVATHFTNENLKPVVDFNHSILTSLAREEISTHLTEMFEHEEPHEDVINYIKTSKAKGPLTDNELLPLIWKALVNNVDLQAKPEQASDAIVKQVSTHAEVLESACQTARTEILLINVIQQWHYENTKVMTAFPKVLRTLYSKDVVSIEAVLYWHSKGASPHGKQSFLASTQKLVDFLKEQQAEEDSDEE
ncbi:ARM repeat-containing protein [Atractiella rhizophila]|nr:ARM repeat-containing protein [Atractiella rhizophila]